MIPERVYFTWPDRGLGYDCRGCGNCCKGLGIGLDAAGGQVRQLVERYPDVVSFLRKRGSTWTAVNPRGRCFFFDDQGLCRIETDHGRAAKPASCRLFPFNRVFRIGSWMIVDYNSVVCPLAPVADGVAHEEVLAEIASVQDPAVIGTELPADDPEHFVIRERAIASACFEGDLEAVWDAMSTGVAFSAAHDSVSEALETITGSGLRLPATETLRAALLLFPSLRFNEIFGPRRWVTTEVLPRVLLGWLGFAAAAVELSGRNLSLQELTGIWGDQLSVGLVCARWHERVAMQPGPVELPGDADPAGVVRGFAERCVEYRQKPRRFGQVWSAALAGIEAPDRVALTRMLEPLFRNIQFGAQGRRRR